MTATIDVATLIASGEYVACPRCSGVVRATTGGTRCRWCRTLIPAAARKPAAATGAVRAVKPDAGAVGGLSGLPGETLWLAVGGKPVTQGSMRAVAAGVVRRESGPQLVAWRDSITQALMRVCGADWETVTGPVRLEAVFTVRRPASYPKTVRRLPTSKPDSDKLLRAVQDALSPKLRKGEKQKGRTSAGLSRFLLLRDDSIIVDSRALKTFPSPMHTHPWALPHPGVVLRICPATGGPPPMPPCTAGDPGGLPAGVDLRFG